MHEVCNEPACCCHCLSSLLPRFSPKGKEALDTKLKQIVVNILALIVAKDAPAPGKLNPIIPSTPFYTSFIFLISKCTLGQNWILERPFTIERFLLLFSYSSMVTIFVAV